MIVLALGLAGCSRTDQPLAVARVDNRLITDDALLTRHLDKVRSGAAKTGKTALSKTLVEMINETVLVNVALRSGLDKRADVLGKLTRIRNQQYYHATIDSLVLDKYVTDSDIQKLYAGIHKTVRVRQIFVRSPKRASALQQLRARKRLDEVMRRLAADEPFERVARRYSDDKRSARNGGDIGFLKWGLSNTRIVREAWLLREGERSRPLQGHDGWTILQVEQIRTLRRPSLLSIRLQLKENVRKRRSDEITAEVRKLSQTILARRGYQVLHEQVDLLAKAMFGREATLDDDLRYTVLAEFNGGKVQINDVLGAPKPRTRDQLETRLQQVAGRKAVIVEGITIGLHERAATRLRIQESQEKLLRDTVVRQRLLAFTAKQHPGLYRRLIRRKQADLNELSKGLPQNVRTDWQRHYNGWLQALRRQQNIAMNAEVLHQTALRLQNAI